LKTEGEGVAEDAGDIDDDIIADLKGFLNDHFLYIDLVAGNHFVGSHIEFEGEIALAKAENVLFVTCIKLAIEVKKFVRFIHLADVGGAEAHALVKGIELHGKIDDDRILRLGDEAQEIKLLVISLEGLVVEDVLVVQGIYFGIVNDIVPLIGLLCKCGLVHNKGINAQVFTEKIGHVLVKGPISKIVCAERDILRRAPGDGAAQDEEQYFI